MAALLRGGIWRIGHQDLLARRGWRAITSGGANRTAADNNKVVFHQLLLLSR